ncbi:hypothetical protein Tco_1423355, partial [Tanacetum coccineum]
MAQQIITAAQLVPKFQGIGRCNNYDVLQSIPCSPECKIVGKILLDHSLSYALTATADAPAVYLQRFWRTVCKVPDTKDTIIFKLDTQEITYTLNMFHDTLKLPVETPNNPSITPETIRTKESFMQTVGYQGVVNKVSAFYTKFLAQPWQTMFKLFHVVFNCINVDYAALLCIYPFLNIAPRLEEDYHSIKDDVPLGSVYTTGNVTIRGMLIPSELLTDEIRASKEYKVYEDKFLRVDVPTIQPKLIESTQGMIRKPRATRTPTPAAAKKHKSKEVARETSTPRKSLNVTIKQKKPS